MQKDRDTTSVLISGFKKSVDWLILIYLRLRPKKTYWLIAVPYSLTLLNELVGQGEKFAEIVLEFSSKQENDLVNFFLELLAAYLRFDASIFGLIVIGFVLLIVSIIKFLERIQLEGFSKRITSRFFSQLLKQYKQQKDKTFDQMDWPYELDKDSFVKIFDFQLGTLLNRDKYTPESNECIEVIKNRLSEKSVFCVGYYGMGKSTIAKYLFNQYKHDDDFVPIFIWLTYLSINEVTSMEKLVDVVFEEIQSNVETYYKADILKAQIELRLREKKILLIMDGIDEARYDQKSLLDFANFLASSNIRFILTSRLEFYLFYEVFEGPFGDNDNYTIELKEWGEKQWTIFCDNISTNRVDEKIVNDFLDSLISEEYGDLPRRPLFLKMLSDLVIRQISDVKLNEELTSNKAEIYFKFINWKILDDYKSKGGNIMNHEFLGKEKFVPDVLRIFGKLATVEFSKIVPENGAESFTDPDLSLEALFAQDENGFDNEVIEQACETLNNSIDYDFFSRWFKESSIFATLRQIGRDLYNFSHKSFLEYLVAHELVDSIFAGPIDEAKCDSNWFLYQTYEVSDHLQDEITRVAVEKQLSDDQIKGYLSKAFTDVLQSSEYNDKTEYNERYEEVLYYVGKYDIRTPSVLAILNEVIENKQDYHPIYFRTACISLTRLGFQEKSFLYVNTLLNEIETNESNYQLNCRLDINYYGKPNLRGKLKPYVDEFITSGQLSKINAIRIFGYFCSIPPNEPRTIESLKGYNGLIGNKAKELGLNEMISITDRIDVFLDNCLTEGMTD